MWSDDLLDQARATLEEVTAALRALGVTGELVLVGGTSVPGALTRGDIDLHLRVDPDAFSASVARLREVYPVASEEAWAGTLAVFEVAAQPPTGLAVTPKHSEHDERFTRTWRAIRNSPVLLAQYNALKTATAGTPAYEQRKSDFFTSLSGS